MKFVLMNNLKLNNVGVMGLSFKENSSDMRNSKIFKLIDILLKKKIKLQILDPRINKDELVKKYKKYYVKKFKRKLTV